tara:strand:+ start:2180 stop:2581 length:402 start_codon:yes stop_codon:yes gene_type:complete
MSLSRITPQPEAGYIEVVIDGHSDWMSAVQRIERIAEAVDELGVSRVLMDFRRVDMHIAVVEAPEVARFFDVFANRPLSFGIIRAGNERADATIDAFASSMAKLGHDIEYLDGSAAAEVWIDQGCKRPRRRAG